MQRSFLLVGVCLVALVFSLIVGPGLFRGTGSVGAAKLSDPPLRSVQQPSADPTPSPYVGAVPLEGAGRQPAGVSPQVLPVTSGMFYQSYSGFDFRSYRTDTNFDYDFGRGVTYIKSGSPPELMTPVRLPQGAQVRSIIFYFYDNSTSDMTLGISRVPVGGSAVFSVFTSTTTSGINTAQVLSRTIKPSTDIPITTIDNAQYSYYLLAFIGAATQSLGVAGARIEYQIPEAMLPVVLRSGSPSW